MIEIGINGTHETFVLRISDQQNASRQGMIARMEKKQWQHFRNLLQ